MLSTTPRQFTIFYVTTKICWQNMELMFQFLTNAACYNSIIYGKINICVPLPSTVKEIIVSYMVRLIFVYPRHQPQGKYLKY